MPFEQHTFTEKELKLMKKYLELLTDREEILRCFSNWLIIIYQIVKETIVGKQQLEINCEREQEMLNILSPMFNKMAHFSGILSDWYRELAFEKENTEKMIEQGHP